MQIQKFSNIQTICKNTNSTDARQQTNQVINAPTKQVSFQSNEEGGAFVLFLLMAVLSVGAILHKCDACNNYDIERLRKAEQKLGTAIKETKATFIRNA